MSFQVASKLIEKRLRDNWAATDVAWDNVDFKPQRGKSWIRFQMSWADSRMIAGAKEKSVHREQGAINISVFTPRGDGPQTNHSLCDSIAALFRNYGESYLYCESPYVVRVGEEEEWFHQNVWIPFYYDNCFEEVV